MYIKKGDYYFENKEYRKAIDAYQKALTIDPYNENIYHKLGIIYADTEKYQKAIEYYQKALGLNPSYWISYNGLGNVYSKLNKYKEAIEAYQEAIKLSPRNVIVYNNLCIVFAKAKEYQKAINASQKIISIFPRYEGNYITLGNIYFEMKKYKEAIEAYQKATELSPNYADAYHNLGVVYTELKEYQKAIKFYQKAITLDPSHEDATYNLDIVYKMLKIQQKGIENMKKICPLCGTENEEDARFCKECNEPLYNQENLRDNSYIREIRKRERKGLFSLFSKKTPSYYSLQQISDAALEAIASNRNNNDIINILKQGLNFIGKATTTDIEQMSTIASLLARPRFGKADIAVKFWERIVEIDPLNFNALRFLVSFYIQQDRKNDVSKKGKLLLESDYRDGIKKDKEIVQLMGSSANKFEVQNPEKSTSSLYGSLGNFYIEYKDYTLAIAAFNIALKINPNNMDALNNIAVAFSHIKDYSEALRYYKRCLEVTPIEMQKEYRESLEKHNLDPTSVIKGLQAKDIIGQMIRKAESEILFNIGECLLMLNKTDDARDILRKSVEKSGDFHHRDLTEVVEEIMDELWKKNK